MNMGGEASLPYYYAKLLKARGVAVWLACHERVADEILASFPDLGARINFVKDTALQKMIWHFSGRLPYRIRTIFVGQLLHALTQRRIRSIAQELSRQGSIDVVFEPSPITPKGLSFIYDVGAPVVIGPLCGGMNFPPAFRDFDSLGTRLSIYLGRIVSHLANKIVPGKVRADVLIVANPPTERALPKGCAGKVLRVFESGVDLDIWRPEGNGEPLSSGFVGFAFSGRFVDWKGVEYLVQAFAKAHAKERMCRLELIGGGELEVAIRESVERLGIQSAVTLHGWVDRTKAAAIIRQADVFVMPSLRECGGTAILEAMALGKPVITTNWGGPADYVSPDCGILVDPSSKEHFIDGLAEAIVRLTRCPEERLRLGQGGRQRVREDYLSWDAKADRIMDILQSVADESRRK